MKRSNESSLKLYDIENMPDIENKVSIGNQVLPIRVIVIVLASPP